jgi:DNA-binding winged helix-turn-helix (wHTH) protein/tetratricopeptide (TPR) repeat protein
MGENHRDARAQFGVFDLNLRTGELRKAGARVKLQDQPLKVLLALLDEPGEIVAREELKRRIWPRESFGDFDHAVNVAVAKLRAALSDSAETPRFVETLPRRGYRFIFPVAFARSTKPADSGTAAAAVPKPAAASGNYRWATAAAITLGVAGIAVAGLRLYWHPKHPLSDKDSVVLADFANSTGDAVFDGALRQGLTVELKQSPFLSIVSDYRVQEALQLMGQKPETRLTPDVAREVCWRTGSAAMLAGSIANLGSQYVLGLKAVNCQTGDSLAEAQITAANKEQVLPALARAAMRVRSELGESLSTVQKFGVPVEQVTTPSLEALEAYGLGRAMINNSEHDAARTYLERAIELDPNFAMAYASLGVSMGSSPKARESFRKAYALRERVSTRERFYIEAHYDENVSGDLEKSRQTYELWTETYPGDDIPRSNLSVINSILRQDEQALALAKESVRLYPGDRIDASLLVAAYLRLNRLAEAQSAGQQALSRGLDSSHLRFLLYQIAFLENNQAEMARQVAWAAGKPGAEDLLLGTEAATAAFFGRVDESRELFSRAAAAALRADRQEEAAIYEAQAGLSEAFFGNFSEARRRIESARSLCDSRDLRYAVALTYAMMGDTVHAEALTNDLVKSFPDDTIVHFNYEPALEARAALNQRDPAKAIADLEGAAAYGSGSDVFDPFYPFYLRGEALLAVHHGSAAAAEFQRVLDHRGIVVNSVTGALAHLGLARAHSLEGNTSKARAAYNDFFTLWKNADPHIAILKQAKAEYARLEQSPSLPD